MSDPLRSNYNSSVADFAMYEHIVDAEYDFDDYEDESLSSYDGSSEEDEMDEDGFCGSYGSPPFLGRSPLPSMSPPPLNLEEMDRQLMFEDFENQQMSFDYNSANDQDSDKAEEDTARFPTTDRTVPTAPSVLTVHPNNNNNPS